MPHCTLALTKDDESETFYKVSDLVLREFQKIEGRYALIGLVKISFPVEEIYQISLD